MGVLFMGAMVVIKIDTAKVDEEAMRNLAVAIAPLVAQAIEDEDVFVYVEQPNIIQSADPIEIFIRLNAQKTEDPVAITEKIADSIGNWKKSTDFPHPLNINVTPVPWYSKIGV